MENFDEDFEGWKMLGNSVVCVIQENIHLKECLLIIKVDWRTSKSMRIQGIG